VTDSVPRARRRALLVGLGQAGTLALGALAERPDVEIVAGVDPRGRQARARLPSGIPVSRSLNVGGSPDLAIVSTPTPSHAEVCCELLDRYPGLALILCEKPAAYGEGDVAALYERGREQETEFRVLLHYAFASEVLWLADRIGDFGEIVSFEARFEDPYADSLAEHAARLTSSWVDSGINALSVLVRLVEPEAVVAATVDPITWGEATISFRSDETAGAGTITTSWMVEARRKQTTLSLVDGTAVELDHDAGTVFVNGSVVFRAGGADSRIERYRTMIGAHLDDATTVPSEQTTLHLHTLVTAALTGHLHRPAT
jgi:predicted dehydrogenase